MANITCVPRPRFLYIQNVNIGSEIREQKFGQCSMMTIAPRRYLFYIISSLQFAYVHLAGIRLEAAMSTVLVTSEHAR